MEKHTESHIIECLASFEVPIRRGISVLSIRCYRCSKKDAAVDQRAQQKVNSFHSFSVFCKYMKIYQQTKSSPTRTPTALVRKKRTSDGSLFECPIVTNYRTFVDDFMKIIQFIEEYNYYITDIMN